jgi:hypothetical protein
MARFRVVYLLTHITSGALGCKLWVLMEAGLQPRSIIRLVVLHNAQTGLPVRTGPASVRTFPDVFIFSS